MRNRSTAMARRLALVLAFLVGGAMLITACRARAAHLPPEAFVLESLPAPGFWTETYRGPIEYARLLDGDAVWSWHQHWDPADDWDPLAGDKGLGYTVLEYASTADAESGLALWLREYEVLDPGCGKDPVELWDGGRGITADHVVVCTPADRCGGLCYSVGQHANYVFLTSIEPRAPVTRQEGLHLIRTLERHIVTVIGESGGRTRGEG